MQNRNDGVPQQGGQTQTQSEDEPGELDDRPQDSVKNSEHQHKAVRRIDVAAAAESGHPSTVDGAGAQEAQNLDVQPTKAVAVPTLPGANTGASLTIAKAQHPGSTATIEILHGKHAGVYYVHPLAAMLPRIKGEAREDLKKSIRRYGQKEPAVRMPLSRLQSLPSRRKEHW